jgi:hypothetical protein
MEGSREVLPANIEEIYRYMEAALRETSVNNESSPG